MINVHSVSAGNKTERDSLDDLGDDGRKILKFMSKKHGMETRTGWS